MKRSILSISAAVILLIGGCYGTTDDKAGSISDASTKKEQYAVHLTKADFLDKVMNYEKNTEEWIFEGGRPCLIDFYADWCAPCRITSPILEELAEEYAGQIDVYKIDTGQERELAAVFGIQSLPTFLFIPLEGRPTMTAGIAQTPEETKQMFRQQIESFLLSKEQDRDGRP